MESQDYKLARDLLNAELISLQQQVAEKKTEIRLLERLWNRFWEPSSSSKPSRPHGESNVGNGQIRTLSEAIRQFASQTEDKFTTAEIIKFVEKEHPELTPVQKSSYSKPLRRLAENRELIIVQKAKGRYPTIYTRPVKQGIFAESGNTNG